MSDCGCHRASETMQRRTLFTLLSINASMFFLEGGTGILAHSTALLADSLDMLADAIVYGLSLYAIGRSCQHKIRAAFWSGRFQMLLAGILVMEVVRRWFLGSEPISTLMVGMGLIALLANLYCLSAIAKHRKDEVHMQASWIFSRNDVIANLSVIASGFLVSLLHSQIPDLVIGLAIALLVLRGGISIIQTARQESSKTLESLEKI